jgi:hypothetical protein
MADTLPAPYGDEMKGISQATGVPLGMIEEIDPYSYYSLSRRNCFVQYFL